jgi:GxxExxY protein
VVDAALKVHRALGPDLLETAYEQCLAHELLTRGVAVRRQVVLPVVYDGVTLDAGYRLDLVVGESVIVEVKAVEQLLRLHEAQVLTYLKLSGLPLAFLINFNVELLKDGVRRFGSLPLNLGVLGDLGGPIRPRRLAELRSGPSYPLISATSLFVERPG